MASVQLFKAFDFSADQDWDWDVTQASATGITIENAGYRQTFTGAFNFTALGDVSGTVNASAFFFNNAEVYRAEGMAHDAARIADFALTEGDTQQTYRYVFSGADTIRGSAEADVLMGYAGNDTLIGGAGIDAAVYAGNFAGYTIARAGDGFTVTDKSGAEGVDTLREIERVVFGDKTIALDVDAGETGGTVYRLYQAAFARTPDLGGVGFWIAQMDRGMSLLEVTQAFLATPEYQKAYGGALSNTELVTRYYHNILDRAPEPGGLNHWVGVLDNKAASVAEVLAAISQSAENVDGLAPVIGAGFEYTPYAG